MESFAKGVDCPVKIGGSKKYSKVKNDLQPYQNSPIFH